MNLKIVKIICYFLFGLAVTFMVVMLITRNPIFGYVGIGVMSIGTIFQSSFWRCPNCKKSLGMLWVKNCPFCEEEI